MVMLDLNIASSGESSSSAAAPPAKGVLEEGSVGGQPVADQMDESGTSNSSVLNAEASAGDEDSVSGFQFGILKPDEGAESGFVTRRLFPAAGESSSSSRPHWVDLSFLQPDIPAEVKILQAAAPPPPPPQQQQVKKSRRGPRSRSSQYRGVTFYRRTGRWESHIWDCGKQVYLGGFDTAHAAARAYDRAAIKFRGVDADINFNLSDYDEDLKQMRNLTKEEFVHILRRQSNGFSRGSSKYRGVTLHKCGRWEARMGQFLGKKAYDKAAIKCNGREAVTNFEPSSYQGEALPEGDNEALASELDLDLRISQPVGPSARRADNPMGIQFHCSSFEAFDAKNSRLQIDNPSSFPGGQPHSLAMAPEHSQVWTALCPGFFPPIEERTMEKRPEVGSPAALPSWAWQMHGPTQLPLFSSAASSGFSTTTPAAAPPPPARHLPFPPPPTTTTTTTTHFYSSG